MWDKERQTVAGEGKYLYLERQHATAAGTVAPGARYKKLAVREITLR
jgi:hypothetical protein